MHNKYSSCAVVRMHYRLSTSCNQFVNASTLNLRKWRALPIFFHLRTTRRSHNHRPLPVSELILAEEGTGWRRQHPRQKRP